MIHLVKRLFVCSIKEHQLDEHCTCQVCGRQDLHEFLPRDEKHCKCIQCGELREHKSKKSHAEGVARVCDYCNHYLGAAEASV